MDFEEPPEATIEEKVHSEEEVVEASRHSESKHSSRKVESK